MTAYYEDRLSGSSLVRCYEIAPSRIRQYLEAEIRFVVERVRGAARVLELGCGYGRVLRRLSFVVPTVVGCDTSRPSLGLARSYMAPRRNYVLVRMDAVALGFRPGAFDAVVCIQNGISAFAVDPQLLVEESARVTRAGGQVLFSSYSPRIWDDRLAWFRAQSDAGLIGEIDEAETGDGTILCKDGFRATTVTAEEFVKLFLRAGLTPSILEVNGSSLFCVAVKD